MSLLSIAARTVSIKGHIESSRERNTGKCTMRAAKKRINENKLHFTCA